jgi:hypothetical protein
VAKSEIDSERKIVAGRVLMLAGLFEQNFGHNL